jgi:hypothetical protein
MLLVVDNFEHLLGQVGILIDIIQASEGVKFLVTSRERLNVREEWVLMLCAMLSGRLSLIMVHCQSERWVTMLASARTTCSLSSNG